MGNYGNGYVLERMERNKRNFLKRQEQNKFNQEDFNLNKLEDSIIYRRANQNKRI